MKKEFPLKKIFGTIAFLIFSAIGMAQERQVDGIVKDEKGQPLQGATVSIKNGTTSTSTKADGKFQIKVPAGKVTLVISFVGYDKFTVTIGENETTVTVKMVESASKKSMDEVVVVGMQRQTRRSATMAVSSVLAKDIENLPSPSIDNLLQGRVAGLNVQVGSGEPGVAPTVVVRGNSKVNTNIGDNPDVAQATALSGPLYVIDGMPTNPEDIGSTIDPTGTNFLAGININDIESVDVQKDAAATAAWGSRGANGVIYITTKRGRSIRPEFRVNIYGGITEQPQLLNTVTGAAERQLKMGIIKQYATPGQLASLPQILTDYNNPYFNNAEDWQGLFYKSGSVKNVDATMSAATDAVNYRISMNYYDESGIIKSFGIKRYSARGNFNFKINPKLNGQFIVAVSKTDRQRGQKYNNSDDNTPVSGPNQPSSLFRLTGFDSSNYSGLSGRMRNKNFTDYTTASLTLNYAILRNLKYTFQASANVFGFSRDYFLPSDLDQVAAANQSGQPSYAESDKSNYSTYFLSNTLNYNKKLQTANHTHSFLLTGSQQFTRDISNMNISAGYNVPSNNIQVVSSIPQSDLSASSTYAADAMFSLLGQAQYDFDGKYLLYGSYRGDASSRFGDNSKWGYFPSVGTGWVVSDEKFMNKLQSKGIISFLKVRASYGISGIQSDDLYAPYNSYSIPGSYNGGTAIQPSYTNGLTKNNLTWTKTEQKNIGIDAQFFKSRIGLSVDVYDRISKDDYFKFNLPFFTGYQSILFNAHDLWVSNRGVEITLTSKNLSKESKLQWNMQATFAYNKNAIAKLPNNNRTFVMDDYFGTSRIFAVGQPIYEMFQMKYMGVYNHQSDIPFNPLTGNVITYFKGNHKVVPGDPIWADVNHIGDVWVGEDNGNQYGDRVPTGDPNPKFTGGWVNDFYYKNFSLSIVSVFTFKREVINTFYQSQISNIVGGYSSNIYSFANTRLPDLSGLNYWTPEKAKDPNYKADFPSINPLGPSYYQYIPITNMFNEDGSYFKIKNVVLSYVIPGTLIKRAKLGMAKVYCIVDNIATIKNSSMPNPEQVDQTGQYTGGLYVTPTKFTLGLDIQF